jgi:hypothetical protein
MSDEIGLVQPFALVTSPLAHTDVLDPYLTAVTIVAE